MISGWVIRLVVSLSLFALVIFEAGSPLVARVQLDGLASDIALEASREVKKAGAASAKAGAERAAAEEGAVLTRFEVTPSGGVAVTVNRTAPSLVFGKWDKTKSYYDVSVDGLSEEEKA